MVLLSSEVFVNLEIVPMIAIVANVGLIIVISVLVIHWIANKK